MADHVTLFATELDLRSRENLVRARQIYQGVPEDAESKVLFRTGFELGMDANAETTCLRIFAAQAGDVQALLHFVRRCAKEFGLSGPWGFEWAHSSSTPIQHGFGGGALVLDLASGDTLAWTDTHGWLVGQLAQAGRVP